VFPECRVDNSIGALSQYVVMATVTKLPASEFLGSAPNRVMKRVLQENISHKQVSILFTVCHPLSLFPFGSFGSK